MLNASYIKHDMIFNVPAGTSRGVLTEKESWFIRLSDSDNPDAVGIGECSLIPGLSLDKRENFEAKLDEICKIINSGEMPTDQNLFSYPAIQFGLETAMLDLHSGGINVLFPSEFTKGNIGIPINGLIWMGKRQSMMEQISIKIGEGYKILKLKVGAISFHDETEVLKSIRDRYSAAELEIRLDANGAWEAREAIDKLRELSKYDIHSVEQPIASGQMSEMAEICRSSTIDIALDEELIGISDLAEKHRLISSIDPKYIILKPSLLGGFNASVEWIKTAEENNVAWWVTSALESNIGLNAIAQWTAGLETTMPQGLGTGQLFTNNIPSPLRIIGDKLFYLPGEQWATSKLKIY